jgi:hypothetical protein
LLWRLPESNWGHTDFQSVALPAELKRHWKAANIQRFIYTVQAVPHKNKPGSVLPADEPESGNEPADAALKRLGMRD